MNTHKNPRVLVVEVDEETTGLIERLLVDRFHAEVECAASLREARGILAAGLFDVVTLAYILPDGTGLELLSEITSKDGHPAVIIITGDGNEQIASWAMRDGAFGYVLKGDVMQAQLSEAIRRAMERSALQRAREALVESEGFYRSLFDNSAEALFIETLEGVIEDANRAACNMFGYEPAEMRGKVANDLVPANRKIDFESAQARLLAGESVEFENVRSDGGVVPVTVSAEEVMTRRGPRYLVRVIDLSEAKRADKIVEQERAVTMTTLDTLPEIFVMIDLEGRYARWNKALNEVTGYTNDDIAHLAQTDFHPREDIPRITAAMERVLSTGEPQMAETRIITKDGKAIPFELSGALVRDDEGNPVAIVGLGRDISERKRSEEALRNMVMETNERREEITALLESTRIVLEHEHFEDTARDIFRLCKKLVGAAAGYVALFTDNTSELVIVDPPSIRREFVPEGPMPVFGLHGRQLEPGKPVIENSFVTSEYSEQMPEGHFAVQNLMLAPLIVGGETAGLMCLANKPRGFDKRDSLMASAFSEIVSIALRNSRNLQMLKESEERFRSVAETANEAIICADSEGYMSFWNAGAVSMFGYSPSEAIGQPLTMIIPERMQQERLQSFIKVASRAEKGAGKTYELVGIRKDGSEFFMEMSRSAPWIIGDDVCVTAIIRDVTVRKAAEEALGRSEAEYRAVVEDQAELITRYLPGGQVTFVNEACARFFGKTRAEVLALDSFIPEILEEDREHILEQLQAITMEEPVVTTEHRAIDGDGNMKWMQWTNHGIYDDDGDLVECQAVGRDITDRRQAEEALRESEQRFRMLFDTAPDVIYSIDSVGAIATLNAAFESWTGFSRDEWVGKPFAPIVHPDDLALAVQTFVQVTQGGRPAPYELRILKKDGEYITAEFISAPLMKKDEIVGEFGIARDVTERKAAQRAVAESEELYRGLLATSPDPVVVTDLDFNVTMVSDQAVEQQRGQGSSDLIGRNALEALLPEGAAVAREEARRIIESGLSRALEVTITRRDGTIFQGELTASLMRDPEGNPRAFITNVRDVTERRRAEHELQVLNNELEGYAHAVSHDLRGPLASIGAASGTIQSLLKGDASKETLEGVTEMAAIIASNVEKSTQLIEDLLELAEAGQRPVDAVKVDISDVVRDILAERRDAIKTKHVKVRVDGDLGTVRASRTHMYQLFSNLIDNAIKHNDARKPVIAIQYGGADKTGGHRYVIKDNGPGIPPGTAEKIFLPFVSGLEGEPGVGLATVAKIVGVYSGTIEVCNDDGACFEFVVHDAR
ncbi:MAG: PAS domain S-box protein [Candidatus Geothermincolia bacterium]